MDYKTEKSGFGGECQAQPSEMPLFQPSTGGAKPLQSLCASVSPPACGRGHTNLPHLVCCDDRRLTLLQEQSGDLHLLSPGQRFTLGGPSLRGDFPEPRLTCLPSRSTC